MTPSTYTETEPEVQATPHVETLILEQPKPKQVPPASSVIPARRMEDGSFQSSMIELNRMKSSTKAFDFVISLLVNLSLLAGPVLTGLYFTDTINLKQFASTFLIAPPPPPPPPPAPAAVAVRTAPARRVFENAGKLVAPVVIPRNVAEIKEAPLPSDDGLGGIAGGVPGGVAGGTLGGVIGGVIGGVKTAVAAPIAPKENRPKAPVRVGGRVREPELVRRVEPAYPPLARQTHMQGVVVIDAVIDEEGNVVEMKVVSGPPLMLQSAMTAVKQWKYRPTYLNDIPIAVQLNIIVTFRLAQ